MSNYRDFCNQIELHHLRGELNGLLLEVQEVEEALIKKPQAWWDDMNEQIRIARFVLLERTFKEAEDAGKAIFVTLDDIEYFVWGVSAEDEEISILPTNETSWGTFETEMICDSYALRVVREDSEEFETVVNAFSTPVDALFAHIVWQGDDEDRMIIHKVSDPLPQDATGKFLKLNRETGAFEFVK